MVKVDALTYWWRKAKALEKDNEVLLKENSNLRAELAKSQSLEPAS